MNVKSVIINSDLHNKLKIFCRGKNLKIGAVVEDLIQLYLDKSRNIQNLIDENKK